MNSPWRSLFKTARRQHGVVHVRQAERLGIPKSSFYGRVKREGWIQLQPGAFLVPGAVRTFLSDLTAVLLAAGRRVAATGDTALHLQGVSDEPPRGVQIALPHDRARPKLQGVDDVIRTSTLHQADIVEVAGLPVLTVPWAILHAGRKQSAQRVLELVITAEHRGLLVRTALDDVIERCGRAPGRAALRSARETLGSEVVDSLLELDARRLLRAAGYQPFPTPFPFRCPDRRVIHLDLPFPAIWFAFECDSPQSRSGGRSFHTDRTRWTQAQRAGWRLGWITRQRLRDDPSGIVEELAAAFATADPERPPPQVARCRQQRCRVCATSPAPAREG